MRSIFLNSPSIVVNCHPTAKSTVVARRFQVFEQPPRLISLFNFQYSSCTHHNKTRARCSEIPRNEDDPLSSSVQELKVPTYWLEPAKASEMANWLRVALHKWLDDEYCPEPTNIEISKVAADSFYNSLMLKRVDLGEILLNMAVELESVSYQESFHGAFSSANAAVNLIVEKILLE